MDVRTWISMARTDVETEDAPDVFVWDDKKGWLADVTFVGGGLDGDRRNCRLISGAQGAGVLSTRPPRPDGLTLIALPNGDPNDDAIIVGQLADDELSIPATVNGDTIVERNATEGQVAAIETHLDIFPEEDLDQEWRNVRITADNMTLAVPDADQPFVRGTDQADALDDVFDAILDFATALSASTPAPPNGALTVAEVIAALPDLVAKISEWKAARPTYLSTKIKGD
jgi:hypothetical protein